ncbi:hypothetical protein [Streptomonospora wellingtoniae]|uniref:Uncharacterized protein n=1 Tax=Streptomonospora wellingtoniae TaxID=3075544 RepID=A0ABU2KRA0_9ACTN|nr:hypothetical protein [Streptomonospora sp. DSM 45055]MDT0301794.1 hypothetical protein [Streptomonospora sp. DSM 45055]
MLWMWPFIVAGMKAADRMFKPRNSAVARDGAGGGNLDRLQTVRAVAGFVVVVGVAVHFEDTESVELVTSGRILLESVAAALAALLVAFGYFLVRARGQQVRAELLRRFLRYSVVSVVLFAGAYLLLYGLSVSGMRLVGDLGQDRWYVGVIAFVAVFTGGSFVSGFVFWSLFMAAKHAFNAADVHPMLPCLCAPIASTGLAVVGLARLEGPTPVWISLALSAAGILTATALSVAEWRLLSRSHGFTLDTVPEPAGRPDP